MTTITVETYPEQEAWYESVATYRACCIAADLLKDAAFRAYDEAILERAYYVQYLDGVPDYYEALPAEEMIIESFWQTYIDLCRIYREMIGYGL